MDEDRELQAIQSVIKAIEGLGGEVQIRILDYVTKRLELKPSHQGSGTEDEIDEAVDFVDLYDRAAPKKDADKALTAAYWLQISQSQSNFTGQQVNTLLKDLGHGLKNVTDSLDTLQNRKPSDVRQVSKSGKTKQARKTYKLTQAGISKVRSILS